LEAEDVRLKKLLAAGAIGDSSQSRSKLKEMRTLPVLRQVARYIQGHWKFHGFLRSDVEPRSGAIDHERKFAEFLIKDVNYIGNLFKNKIH